jgi:hypothetical protein
MFVMSSNERMAGSPSGSGVLGVHGSPGAPPFAPSNCYRSSCSTFTPDSVPRRALTLSRTRWDGRVIRGYEDQRQARVMRCPTRPLRRDALGVGERGAFHGDLVIQGGEESGPGGARGQPVARHRRLLGSLERLMRQRPSERSADAPRPDHPSVRCLCGTGPRPLRGVCPAGNPGAPANQGNRGQLLVPAGHPLSIAALGVSAALPGDRADTAPSSRRRRETVYAPRHGMDPAPAARRKDAGA